MGDLFKIGDRVSVIVYAIGNKFPWVVNSIDGCMVEISQIGQPNEWVHFSEIIHYIDD